MKITAAIKRLQDLEKEGETDLIVAWWDADAFGNPVDWEYLCDTLDYKMDWSGTHDKIQTMITYILNKQ